MALESFTVDTAGLTDTVAAPDTIPVGEGHYALLFERPEEMVAPEWSEPGVSMSWVIAPLILLFLFVAIKYRGNSRYAKVLLREMYEVRERGNAFDDTVRETTFLVLLNLLWSGSAGILLAVLIGSATPMLCGVTILLGVGYTLFMTMMYWIVGSVFSSARRAGMWVRGYLAAQGLSTIIIFPAALLSLCYPDLNDGWLLLAGIGWIIFKLIFIIKGFRIFFTQIAAWVLFLYYLCSLEIVPLILTYGAALFIRSRIL